MKSGGDVNAVPPSMLCTKCDCHSKSKEEQLVKEASEKKQPKGLVLCGACLCFV